MLVVAIWCVSIICRCSSDLRPSLMSLHPNLSMHTNLLRKQGCVCCIHLLWRISHHSSCLSTWKFVQVVKRMMSAFEGRCKALYGDSSLLQKRKAHAWTGKAKQDSTCLPIEGGQPCALDERISSAVLDIAETCQGSSIALLALHWVRAVSKPYFWVQIDAASNLQSVWTCQDIGSLWSRENQWHGVSKLRLSWVSTHAIVGLHWRWKALGDC